MPTYPQLKKDFVNTLNGLSGSRHKWNVFSDWLEITAITLHQAPYHAGDFPKDETFNQLEEKYLEVTKRYDRSELTEMAKLMGITLMAHQLQDGDFLGELAGEEELLSKWQGQFFTPYSLSRLLAGMVLANAREVLEEQGIITISEPASGGGALVIACAEELKHQGIDPRSCAQFDCIDVSRDAFNMTYIQVVAQDLQAIVRHGNTLSLDIGESRPTPQLRYFNQWFKERQAEAKLKLLLTDPDALFDSSADEAVPPDAIAAPKSVEAEQTQVASEPEQASLFDMEGFAGSDTTSSRRPRRKADVVLPVDRQLGLFSKDREAE
ncbi:MAG: N-6 DNA methylase [Leptolyngbya sp. SIO4C1]|nr:N-6 DNA methylase [Leptolyngbya sp. SIO4C1]